MQLIDVTVLPIRGLLFWTTRSDPINTTSRW